MTRVAFVLALLSLALGLAACSPDQIEPVPVATNVPLDESQPQATPLPTAASEQPVTLPISIYIVDSEDGQLSSGRSAEQLAEIYQRVNDIWSQAGITIEVQTIERLNLPTEVVQAIAGGDYRPFLSGIGRQYEIPEPSLLNAFYAREIGGANGVAPQGTRLFFVMDEPSVHHERVSSHEIGHILGLHHTTADQRRLMFPGSNGMDLAGEEIVVARYVAQGLLDRQR